MSNVQIPNLGAAIALNGSEQLEAVQAGTSVRVTTNQIAELAAGSLATINPGKVIGRDTVSGIGPAQELPIAVDASGNVGIGTAAPAAKLNVVESGTATALLVTNTGTGDSFVVEDSASTDTSPFVITSSGQVVVGATTAFAASTLTPGVNFQGLGGSGGANALGLNAFSADSSGPVIYFGKSRGATVGSAGLVSSGDFLGSLFFEGSDGVAQKRGASIAANVDGTPGVNDMPGRLVFSTTADGASTVTERMRIDSSGQVGIGTTSPDALLTVNTIASFGDGAAATPSIAHKGDLNTGIWFPAADTIAASTAGTEKMRIEAGGNVGIGTTSPDALLTVNTIASFGDGAAATPSIAHKGDLNTGIWFPAADTISASTAGIERMRITSGGLVGIGTTSPDALLTVNTIASFADGAAATPSIAHKGDLNTGIWFPAADTIAASTAGTERMRITSGGLVGIGTTPTTALLDVQSTTAGVRFPNMTTVQKNAIATPQAGTMVFDTTLAKLCVYSGAAWQTITSV